MFSTLRVLYHAGFIWPHFTWGGVSSYFTTPVLELVCLVILRHLYFRCWVNGYLIIPVFILSWEGRIYFFILPNTIPNHSYGWQTFSQTCFLLTEIEISLVKWWRNSKSMILKFSVTKCVPVFTKCVNVLKFYATFSSNYNLILHA